jgi:hypothetical protein
MALQPAGAGAAARAGCSGSRHAPGASPGAGGRRASSTMAGLTWPVNLAACAVTGLFGHRAAQRLRAARRGRSGAAGAALGRRAGCWPGRSRTWGCWPGRSSRRWRTTAGCRACCTPAVGVVCVGLLVNGQHAPWPRFVGACVLAALAAKIVAGGAAGPGRARRCRAGRWGWCRWLTPAGRWPGCSWRCWPRRWPGAARAGADNRGMSHPPRRSAAPPWTRRP